MACTLLKDPELIEVALAHVDKDEVRSAYNRADYIERRRPMMAWWSAHIQKCSHRQPAGERDQRKPGRERRADTLSKG